MKAREWTVTLRWFKSDKRYERQVPRRELCRHEEGAERPPQSSMLWGVGVRQGKEKKFT